MKSMNIKFLIFFIATIVIVVFGVKFRFISLIQELFFKTNNSSIDQVDLLEYKQEPKIIKETSFSKSPINNFTARVLMVKANVINAVIDSSQFTELDDYTKRKKHITIIVRGETKLFKGNIDDSGGIIKRKIEKANLEDIQAEIEINVFTNSDILQDKIIDALEIEIIDRVGSDQWLSVFEGWVSDIIDGNNFYINVIENNFEENTEICNFKKILVHTEENIKKELKIDEFDINMGLRVFADNNILEENSINALGIEIVTNFLIPPVCNIQLQQGKRLDWLDILH